MAEIKRSSTIQQNKKQSVNKCPVTYAMDKIGGYWKPIIIYHLAEGCKRYSELKRAIPDITEKMLIQNLKQLEADRIILRDAKPVVPPYVSYSLTSGGKSLLPVMDAIATWGINDRITQG